MFDTNALRFFGYHTAADNPQKTKLVVTITSRAATQEVVYPDQRVQIDIAMILVGVYLNERLLLPTVAATVLPNKSFRVTDLKVSDIARCWHPPKNEFDDPDTSDEAAKQFLRLVTHP